MTLPGRAAISSGIGEEGNERTTANDRTADDLTFRSILGSSHLAQASGLHQPSVLDYLHSNSALLPGVALYRPPEDEIALVQAQHLKNELLKRQLLLGISSQVGAGDFLSASAALSDLELIAAERQAILSRRLLPLSIRCQLDRGLASLAMPLGEVSFSSLSSSARGDNISSMRNGLLPSMDTAMGKILPDSEEQVTVRKTKVRKDGSHPPVIVYMESDGDRLSEYQSLLRKQVELFEATADDVKWNSQGRNKPIFLGQVGIRCRYCASLPTWSRSRGAVYYSATMDGLYQAAQNMAKNHLCRHCELIPKDTREKLQKLRDSKKRASGGKKYWATGAQALGVIQESDGLRFETSQTGRQGHGDAVGVSGKAVD